VAACCNGGSWGGTLSLWRHCSVGSLAGPPPSPVFPCCCSSAFPRCSSKTPSPSPSKWRTKSPASPPSSLASAASAASVSAGGVNERARRAALVVTHARLSSVCCLVLVVVVVVLLLLLMLLLLLAAMLTLPEAPCTHPGSSEPAAPADPWGCVHAHSRAGGAETSASVGQRSCGTRIEVGEPVRVM
jgi:hypothetical protein